MISKWNIVNNSYNLVLSVALQIVILELRNYDPTECNRSLNRGRQAHSR